MGSPTSFGSLGIGGSGVGSLFSAGGSLFKGFAESEMYGYQSAIAQLNAKVAAQNSEYAIASGEQSAATEGMKTRFLIGQTRAKQGASNLAGGTGNDVIASERYIGNINAATIRNNAARTAFGYRAQAAGESMKAEMYDSAGSNARVAGGINALGSLISGATSVSTKWSTGKQYGLGG